MSLRLQAESATSKPARLQGKYALVTGGARGIGRAIVECFLREGATVAFVDCDHSSGGQLVREAKQSGFTPPLFLPCNIASQEDLRGLPAALSRSVPYLDILVNNAGVEVEKPLAEQTEADWDYVLGVNLKAPFLLSRQLAPYFSSHGGAIINISSIHASFAFPGSVPYACSKAGLIALTRNLALELAPQRIRVNAICPGYIDTHLWEEYLSRVPDPDAVAQATTNLHPLGRRGLPQDVAEAALFFAEDAASFITGTQVVVDGGLTIRAHP
jgi:NAD(P)-dependent dehydrogenase (short-subunit alcohol dehydrogenase family)